MRLSALVLLAALSPACAQTAPPAPASRTMALFERGDARSAASTAASGRAVVSAADPRAAEAGLAMLRAGGSAADAAIAVGIALTVVEPQSSGLGGGGFAMIHDAVTGRPVALDGRETAPAAARADRFMGPDGKALPGRQAVWGGGSVGVPGHLALMAELHRRHGRLPWAQLFAPAIALAEDGVTVTPRFARILAARAEMVAASTAADIFTPGGVALRAGARARQPELARTLRALAASGRDTFYIGPIAARIAAAATAAPRAPALLTTADLAAYRVIERAPLCAPYRGWRLCGFPPPSSGGIAVAQLLGTLERFDLDKLGRENPLSWHLIAEAQRLAFADRAAWAADPGFVAVPTDALIDRAYITERSAMIRLDRAAPTVTAGRPAGARALPQAATVEDGGTSHLVAADAAGNVVSLTQTIESIFGSGQVAAGFFLNNELTDFELDPGPSAAPHPNRMEPGKRPRSSMAPLLLYAPDGRLAGAVGAAGGATIIAQVAKTVIGVVDWRLSIEDAIDLPLIYANGPRVAIERGSRLEAMAATLKALGHDVQPADLPIKTNALARVRAGWRGAADPRSEGQAVAIR